MYINFQQNRANRSVITVHTNVFAKKSQVALQLPIENFKNRLFETCIIVKRNFQQNRVSRSVKTEHTNVFAKIFESG